MTTNLMPWARPLALVVSVVVGLTLAAPPATSADSTVAARSSKPTIATTAAAKLAHIDTARAVRLTQQATASPAEGRSFFRSPRGVAVLALMVVGIGYVVYSTQHDDVKRSPVR